MQLALELRTMEAVPVALRASARWPEQVGAGGYQGGEGLG